MTFLEYLKSACGSVDHELRAILDGNAEDETQLHTAMEYSLFSGGKRLRPAMVLFSNSMFSATNEPVLESAVVD